MKRVLILTMYFIYISSQESGRMECRTGTSKKKGKGHVIIKFDQRDRTYESGFTYVENPILLLEKVSSVN